MRPNQAIAAAFARAKNLKMKIAVSVCDEGRMKGGRKHAY
jgi:hypothetical protein